MLPDSSFQTEFAYGIYSGRYKHPQDKNWSGTGKRVIGSVMGELYKAPKAQSHISYIEGVTDRCFDLMKPKKFIPGGRYLYAAGRDLHQVCNCILLRAEDSREGWAELAYKSAMALMTGAGIGVWYGDIRSAGSPIHRTGGIASGPLPLMELVNDQGRCYLQGGNRRSAIWAGLSWSHDDIFRFITSKEWSDDVRASKQRAMEAAARNREKEKLYGRNAMGVVWESENFAAPMDTTNISVTLDDEFFSAYIDATHPKHKHAHAVYAQAVAHMLQYGEPGFTVDVGEHAGEVLRNACTEITSADDSDVCNLGSLVLPRFDSVGEWRQALQDTVMFLTAGSMYSDMPYKKVGEVRDQNRRLGLGIMGVHEFLMQKGVRYGTAEAFEVLEPYMVEYARALEYANEQQTALGVSPSIGGTAIAPNGTIGAIAETTPSADPMFSSGEIRTVVSASPNGDVHTQHVVVDPTAARLVREGVKPDLIEDAHSLSLMPERRIAQQAFLQGYTDHAISSTVNLHAPIVERSEVDDFGSTLMKHLPNLRGITCYPNGAIAGQPRKPVDLEWAIQNEGTIVESELATCSGGVCGE